MPRDGSDVIEVDVGAKIVVGNLTSGRVEASQTRSSHRRVHPQHLHTQVSSGGLNAGCRVAVRQGCTRLGSVHCADQVGGTFDHHPVSYTHLTLPTILRV